MRKLISLFIALLFVSSLCAQPRSGARGGSRASAQRRASSSSAQRKALSRPAQQRSKQQTMKAAGSGCPFSSIKDPEIKDMLTNPRGTLWSEASHVYNCVNFINKHPSYRIRCSHELSAGYDRAQSVCRRELNSSRSDRFPAICEAKTALNTTMIEAGVWESSGYKEYAFNEQTRRWEERQKPQSGKGALGQTGNGLLAENVDKSVREKEQQSQNAQYTRLLADVQKNIDNLKAANQKVVPVQIYKSFASQIDMAVQNHTDLAPLIEYMVKEGNGAPSSPHYVPTEYVNLAFMAWASTLKPGEGDKLSAYLRDNQSQRVREAAARATAEYAATTIGPNQREVKNTSPAGHLILSSAQRGAASRVLMAGITAYHQKEGPNSNLGTLLDEKRLTRLYSSAESLQHLQEDVLRSPGGLETALAAAPLLLTALGEGGSGAVMGTSAQVIGTGAGVAGGTTIAAPALFVTALGFGAYALNDAYSPGYKAVFQSALNDLRIFGEKMDVEEMSVPQAIAVPGTGTQTGTKTQTATDENPTCQYQHMKNDEGFTFDTARKFTQVGKDKFEQTMFCCGLNYKADVDTPGTFTIKDAKDCTGFTVAKCEYFVEDLQDVKFVRKSFVNSATQKRLHVGIKYVQAKDQFLPAPEIQLFPQSYLELERILGQFILDAGELVLSDLIAALRGTSNINKGGFRRGNHEKQLINELLHLHYEVLQPYPNNVDAYYICNHAVFYKSSMLWPPKNPQ